MHMMVSRLVRIQGVVKFTVKVKDHVIRAVLCWHENRFFSQTNSRIATKLTDDGLQVLHTMISRGHMHNTVVTNYYKFQTKID